MTDESNSPNIGIDDPGRESDAPQPLSPEEYAEAQKEAREGE